MENNMFNLNIPPLSLFQPQANLNLFPAPCLNPLAKIQLFDKMQEENIYLKNLLKKLLMSKSIFDSPESTQYLSPLKPSIPKFENFTYDFPLKSQKLISQPDDSFSATSDCTEDTLPTLPASQETFNIKKEELENDKHIEDSLYSSEEERPCDKEFKIRRTGFKQENAGETKKTNKKAENVKQRRSKAKHLWVSYGRRIVEYAWKNTEGSIKDNIQACMGKLKSKKGYSEVFLVRKSDTEEEVEFKKVFGKLAIEFIENETEDSFLSSNYRGDFIQQKDKVAKWIACLISC